jgi:TatA/E family protein of Tat protein translocase
VPLTGHWEIVILAVVALALFGGGMLPKLARTAGRTVREVKSVKDDMLSLESAASSEPRRERTHDRPVDDVQRERDDDGGSPVVRE